MQPCLIDLEPIRRPPSGLSPRAARRLIVIVVGLLVGWTTGANLWIGREYTSSQVLHNLCSNHPAVAFGLGAYCFSVFRDAVPEVSWGVLFVVVGAAFSAGHCLWPLR